MAEFIELPIFPLNLVLYPNSRIPLYIFEKRYKIMIRKCIENKSTFGINLYSGNTVYTTGCSASVEEVVVRNENGEMNIIVRGQNRYKTMKYGIGKDGYYIGSIVYIKDDNPEYDIKKMEKAVSQYNDLVKTVYKGTVKKVDLNEQKWQSGKMSVTFFMAEKCGLSLMEKQNLLEADGEDKRLDLLLKYFKEVIPKIKEADVIAGIIKSNGYIQQ